MDRLRFTDTLRVEGQVYRFYDITKLQQAGIAEIDRLPFSIRVLVENLLRKLDVHGVEEDHLMTLARWRKAYDTPFEIPYHPARVLMQDFTGVPAVVDLAAMRDAMKDLGGDPRQVNPLVPVDLVIDHSIQVDAYGTCRALERNVAREYERNGERYALLKWAQQSFDDFRVIPPRSGICHQVNLEYLSRVVIAGADADGALAYPDTLVGLDSHTTMVDALGVLGWGVGGIEAEAVMLGQPYYLSIPQVIGVRLVGEPKPEITATDLVLAITERLRAYGVVEKFVEFFGPGMAHLSLPARATISNMTPEYGATLGLFPIDDRTIDYLRLTNRKAEAALVDAYARRNALFYTGSREPDYTAVVDFDLAAVEPAVAGPARPQDRIPLADLKSRFAAILGCDYERDADPGHLSQFHDESGSRTTRAATCTPVSTDSCSVQLRGEPMKLMNGNVVIAAITSCTNTSNPEVLMGAGLLAKEAVRRGLKVPPYVKTSFAPGSRAVAKYLEDAGLVPYLEALGFHLVGFGCTTCIGNSGPLDPVIERAIEEHDLMVAAVLSGNRNFEARIHQRIRGNFLASPMLVVAFALAGRVDIDLTREPVGLDPNGDPVYLEELWPDRGDIEGLISRQVKREIFAAEYDSVCRGDHLWQRLPDSESVTYPWDSRSTYIKSPPFFKGIRMEPDPADDIVGARVLAVLGDSITTDHISPAGAIPETAPAGLYLRQHGVDPADFNSYGSRRGNHEVMMRGTFANVRLRNQLAGGREGGFTRKFPEGEVMPIYDAAMAYAREGVPLIVLGGRQYGTGSSRDWAAKGTRLLGVRAVLAGSFERIHRSNLVGMGVLPLVFRTGDSAENLGLDGSEIYTLRGIQEIGPRASVRVTAEKEDGRNIEFITTARLDTDIEVRYFRHGGILPYVLRKMVRAA